MSFSPFPVNTDPVPQPLAVQSDNQMILIVDDNPTNLDVLSQTLTNSGFQVAVAVDGETALEQVEYHQPALILLDVMMPGIDGFETCYRLKSNPQTADIPVIFTTALSDAENKVMGLSVGAVDYITKPFQREEVLARVKVHLKLRNLARTLEAQNHQLKYEIAQRQQTEDLLQELNQTLEQRVADRTAELTQALQEIEQTQVQLAQSEKMSSLGQLVAGVAHEINNPINFIYGNFQPASDYTQDLLQLAHLCQKNREVLPAEISSWLEAMDFEFIQEDLPKLLSSMQVGADRIRRIVLSLRNFSRLDEADMKPVDLHEGLDSTLLILQHRLKTKSDGFPIQVIKDYGALPSVTCYPSQLNQVVMNLIANAIDALEEHQIQSTAAGKISEVPMIQISTGQVSPDWVEIRIADNGPGIPEHLRSQIFNPFFTTKPIGKGTGLGLSISYQIVVDKHGGKLLCNSEADRGTEFRIQIPLHQMDRIEAA